MAELLEWYRGEVGGEALFSALAQAGAEPERAAKWRKLAQLEHCVAGRLATLLEEHGISIPSAAPDLERGLSSAQEYIAMTWHQTLTRMRAELIGYVSEFQAAESRMPQEILPLAQFVTEHERALLDFVTRELDQDSHHSLDRVLSLLGEATAGRSDPQPTRR